MTIAAFSAPVLGMLTQSSAFGTISENISNLNTGGYRATDTRFNTVFAKQFGQNHDIGGVQAVRKNYVDLQGNIVATANNMDLAIAGHGMFVVNTEVDGSGEQRYTRDGGFQVRINGTADKLLNDGTTVQVPRGYLADKNGNYVLGWTPNADGTFTTSSTPAPMRIDNDAFLSEAAATEGATTAINLPATANPGDTQVTTQSVYDDKGGLHSFDLVWTRGSSVNEWSVYVRSNTDDPDSTTLDNGSTLPNSTSPQLVTFDTNGHLTSSDTLDIQVSKDTDGDTSTAEANLAFSLDVSDVTQIGDHFINFDFQRDGRGPGELKSWRFDESGTIQGLFTNGIERPLYKLPLATFKNADGLTQLQGNEYVESTTSGEATLRQVKDPAVTVDASSGNNQEKNEFALFVPFSHELSNVNLSNEFSLMIMTQQAYNSNATVFKTADEMTKVAADLKA